MSGHLSPHLTRHRTQRSKRRQSGKMLGPIVDAVLPAVARPGARAHDLEDKMRRQRSWTACGESKTWAWGSNLQSRSVLVLCLLLNHLGDCYQRNNPKHYHITRFFASGLSDGFSAPGERWR